MWENMNVNAAVTIEKFGCLSDVRHKITICPIKSTPRNVPNKNENMFHYS